MDSSAGGARERSVVFVTLLVGYAAFYLCRANVDAALPFLSRELHYDKERLGLVSSLGILSYAIGKLVLGALADVIGGKRIILVAVAGSVVATVAIGLTAGLVMFGVAVVANRFFQSGGWGGLVSVASKWFPPAQYGAVMGGLSTSYEIGNVIALVLSGLISSRFGWRALFVVNPMLFLAVGVGVAVMLRPAPKEPLRILAAAHYRDARAIAVARPPLREILAWLLTKPALYFAVALSFLLTFVRTGFLTWTPMLLTEIAVHDGGGRGGGSISASIIKSAVFPACGVIAAITMGKLSDRFGPGRRAPAMALSLFLLVIAILVLATVGVRSTGVAVLSIGACGLFLLGPYSLLGGACTLDVAETKGAATAAGIIDGVGYLGATMSGVVIGTVASRHGWASAFYVVAAATAVAAVVAVVWALVARPREGSPAEL
jgi:sugar phosphate permease